MWSKADQVEELKKKCFESVFQEDFDSAAKFAGEALDIEPNEKEIFNLAQSVYDTWDFNGAIKLYDKVLKKNPNHFDALMGKAAALRYIRENDKAIRCYNKILKNQPTNPLALMSKVDTYIYGIRDAQKAIPILKKILKLSPNSIELSILCAGKFAVCGEYDQAIKINEKVISKDPNNIGARFAKLNWLEQFMSEQRTEKDALKIINKYLKNDPKFKRDVVARKTFSKLRSAIGGLYIYRRDYPEAEHAFKQAIALYDLSPEANFRLADAYVQQRKFDDAINQINKFLEKDTDNEKVKAYRNQLVTTRDKDQRRGELERRLIKGADMSSAAELLGIYRDLGQTAKFHNLANDILSKKEAPIEFFMKVGEIAVQGRRWNIAERAYKIIVQRSPQDFASWIELSAVQLASRKMEEGFRSIAQAVQAGGQSAQRILRSDKRFKSISNHPAFKQLVPVNTAQGQGIVLPSSN